MQRISYRNVIHYILHNADANKGMKPLRTLNGFVIVNLKKKKLINGKNSVYESNTRENTDPLKHKKSH